MSNQTPANLWNRIELRLDRDMPGWRTRLQSFGQMDAVKHRAAGKPWSNERIHEGMVKAVLSSNTDWAKIESVLPQLGDLFENYSLTSYAKLTPAQIDQKFVPWFKLRKAASMTLGKDLKNLIGTAQRLDAWSKANGSADHYFTDLHAKHGNDAKRLALRIGHPSSHYKLPALGVPIAAEALRNIGFDLAKPDRHILRAAGAFGLVQFKNWKDQSAKKPPSANQKELLATMTAFESLAKANNQSTVYVDNAVWLLCAKSGLGLSNAELKNI